MSAADTFLAIVNPAAGAGAVASSFRKRLIVWERAESQLEVVETTGPGQGTQLARDGYARGYRKFIAVGATVRRMR